MSWSVNRKGARDAVRSECAADFDRCAAMYKGHEEELDVLTAKERVLSAIDEIVLHDLEPGISVVAAGSRSPVYFQISVMVQRVPLKEGV